MVDVWRPLHEIDGVPLKGGAGRVRVRVRSAHGVLLEVEFPGGVRSAAHVHQHDSHLYLLEGQLVSGVDGRVVDIGPGETLLHRAGVSHYVEAVLDSRWLEFKSPAPDGWD